MRKAVVFLAAFGLSSALALAAVMCPATSFDLNLDFDTMAVFCLLLPVWFIFAAGFKSPWVYGALTLAPFGLIAHPGIRDSLMSSAFRVFSDVFGVLSKFYPAAEQVAEYSSERADGGCTMFFVFGAAVIIAFTVWTVRRNGSIVPAFFFSLLMLAPCLFIVETVPDMKALLTLVTCLCLLIMTHSQRAQSVVQGGALMLYLVIPAAVFVLLLAFLFPQSTYERPSWPDELRENLNYRLDITVSRLQGQLPRESLFPDLDAAEGGTAIEMYSVDLSALGPRVTSGMRVMQIKDDNRSGAVYLRGVSFVNYGENIWSAADPELYPQTDLDPLTEAGGAADGSVSLRTAGIHPVMFTSYYLTDVPAVGEVVGDMYVANIGDLQEYGVSYSQAVGDSHDIDNDYYMYTISHYLYVPSGVYEQLVSIAENQGLFGLDWDEIPSAVSNFVKSSAVYDLDTPAVPEGQDFVLWFLKESHRGYCVHFASATCLLLRTIGIPARYVTGYMATSRAGQWSAVTDRDAHAWVEYYVDGVGWLPLECTPSDDSTEATPQPTVSEAPTPEVSTVPEATPTPAVSQAPSPAPSAQLSPIIGAPGGAAPKKGLGRWLYLLFLPLFAGLMYAYRRIVLHFRRQRYRASSPNKKALLLWHEAVKMCRVLKCSPPVDMEDVALKARFSSHTISPDELAGLIAIEDELRSRLKSQSMLQRALWKFVLVLY